MSEAQYKEYDKLPRAKLGLMSNEVWQRDPKMLGIHLARYKFVAQMLKGNGRVAEIGCGDGFYSRVVEQEVQQLNLFDFDRQFAANHPKMMLRDIIKTSLATRYNAIYSLDVMEHILPEEQNFYLRNICNSLLADGMFIVGMPSLESQAYASTASKEGHVNCKSGEVLRETLQDYFKNVFLFGMNDETLHTGFAPMCHYILCVCVGVK